MNEEIIREIALTVVNETLLKNWYFYLIMLAIGFLGAYFGAYIKGYAKEKAKHRAITSDLTEIKNQLQETTKVTEKIKNDLEHEVWRKKTVESTKREKLEQYFNLIYAGKESLHEQMISAFFHGEETYDKHAINKADILQKLYFPELSKEHSVFQQAVGKYYSWIAKGRQEIVDQMKDGATKPTPSKEHLALQSEIQNNTNDAAALLTEAGKNYAESLNA